MQPYAVRLRPLRKLRIFGQHLPRVMRPVGVEQRLSADRDQVGIPVLKDGLGLGRLHDEADGLHGDVRFAADARSVRDLETQPPRRGRGVLRDDTARTLSSSSPIQGSGDQRSRPRACSNQACSRG